MATGETRYALVERKCVVFYLIIVFREGSQARFELLTTHWNLLAFQCNVCCIPLSAYLWHAKKDIIYAWIVDRLTWTSTTSVSETYWRFPRKHPYSFLYMRAWSFTKKGLYHRCFLSWEIFENGWRLKAWDVYFRRISISHHNNIFQLLLFIMSHSMLTKYFYK